MELEVKVEANVVLAQERVDEVLVEAAEDEDEDVGGEALLVVATFVEPADNAELVEEEIVTIGVVVATELLLLLDVTD